MSPKLQPTWNPVTLYPQDSYDPYPRPPWTQMTLSVDRQGSMNLSLVSYGILCAQFLTTRRDSIKDAWRAEKVFLK